jgi:hypothetical protein
MEKDYTHISIVLDKSGSMYRVWSDTINGVKSFINEQHKLKSKCTLSLTVFSDSNSIKFPIVMEDINNITDSTIDALNIIPDGATALRDAIGATIVNTGKKLAELDEAKRPDKVLILIQTDGQENSSEEYTTDVLSSLIEDHTSKYSWEFMFVGTDKNAVLSAQSYGISSGSTSTYSIDNIKSSFTTLGKKTMSMRGSSRGSSEYLASVTFSDDEINLMNSSN